VDIDDVPAEELEKEMDYTRQMKGFRQSRAGFGEDVVAS
jgi:hypothetical protein